MRSASSSPVSLEQKRQGIRLICRSESGSGYLLSCDESNSCKNVETFFPTAWDSRNKNGGLLHNCSPQHHGRATLSEHRRRRRVGSLVEEQQLPAGHPPSAVSVIMENCQ